MPWYDFIYIWLLREGWAYFGTLFQREKSTFFEGGGKEYETEWVGKCGDSVRSWWRVKNMLKLQCMKIFLIEKKSFIVKRLGRIQKAWWQKQIIENSNLQCNYEAEKLVEVAKFVNSLSPPGWHIYFSQQSYTCKLL